MDDVLSVRHWLFALTGIGAEVLDTPKGFERPVWFVEEISRIPEPRRPDLYTARVSLQLLLLADTQERLASTGGLVEKDLAQRMWTLPLYNSVQQQVGFLRECRLTAKRVEGLDRPYELTYQMQVPYEVAEAPPLTEIHTRFDPNLTKGGE